MAARYFIVVGDTTTGGGQAVEGYSGWKVECLDGSSRSVVRVGDQVLCGQCGPTTAIEGYAFAFVPSGLLAYDKCALACGHKLISKSQRLFSWDSSSQYSVQFVVHDAKGEPIPNFEYVLVDSVGNELTGTTDNLGRPRGITRRCSPDSSCIRKKRLRIRPPTPHLHGMLTMTQPKNRRKPIATAVVSEDHHRQHVAYTAGRRVRYEFLAAQKDENGEGGKAGDRVVTDSASRLSTLPYVVTAAGDKTRVLCTTLSGKSFARLGVPFNTPEVRVPDDVTAVEVYLGNDAFAARRFTPLFRVELNDTGLTRVVIHELPVVRLKRLQSAAATSARFPTTPYSGTSRRTDGIHVGYLTGDVWRDLSYEFTPNDVRRLCAASALTRAYADPRGRERIRPGVAHAPMPPTIRDQRRPAASFIPVDTTTALPRPIRQGDQETLTISDWSPVLAPIYEGQYTNLVGTRHFDWGCTIDLPVVNIRLRYVQGAFANATGAGDEITIADVLKRTHPATYRGAIEAAWKAGIDELSISSTWRPMLGSVLHRLGIGLDIVFVDDLDDRDASGQPINQFKVHIGSGSRSALYRTFEAIVFADNNGLGGFKADPWINTDPTHQHHLHVSAIDADAE